MKIWTALYKLGGSGKNAVALLCPGGWTHDGDCPDIIVEFSEEALLKTLHGTFAENLIRRDDAFIAVLEVDV